MARERGAATLSDSMTAKQEATERESPLRPVHQRKVSTIVAQQILELIRSGPLAVGARLPSEQSLADRMGVSRPSVREALAALEAVGVVDARAGRGSFVRRIPSPDGDSEPLVLLETEQCCQEIIDARGTLEPPAAALAARARTDDDLACLRYVQAEMARFADNRDFDNYMAQDKAYHQALLEATHNRLVIQTLLQLVQSMDQKVYREFTRNHYVRTPREWQRVLSIHTQILRAVTEADGPGAARAMKTHWQRMKRAYEA